MLSRKFLIGSGYLLPPLLLILFFWKGQHYDPARFRPPGADRVAIPVMDTSGDWLLQNEQAFSADRMYQKINGKAHYYLEYGATKLFTGEWVEQGDVWDMYLYEFETAKGAHGAFTGERPGERMALPGVEGYSVPGMVAASGGFYYLQLTAQTADADPQSVEALVRTFMDQLGGEMDEHPQETTLMDLAGDAAQSDSEEYIPENAFGFSSLHDVNHIRVRIEGVEAIWFSMPASDEVVNAYKNELQSYGGQDLFDLPDGFGGSMFGSWELIAVDGDQVWGVRNAASRAELMKHWNALRAGLNSKAGE